MIFLSLLTDAPVPTEQSGLEDEPFLSFIDREIAETERALEKVQQKLAVLKDLRNDYLARPANFSSDERPFTSTQMLATRAIAAFLRTQTDPVPTKTLLNHLAQQGIRFGGRQPRNALSVLLSRSKAFVPHGRRGWTLARDGDPT
jgi:hypothetical protein